MNIQQLKTHYPDIYKQAVQEGIINESNRLSDLDRLAKLTGRFAQIAEAKEKGLSAGEIALEIVKANIQDIEAKKISEAEANLIAEEIQKLLR